MEDQRSFYLRGRVGLVLFYLAPDSQVDEGSYGEASLPGLGRVCVPLVQGPEPPHLHVLGDVDAHGLEGGVLGRLSVQRSAVGSVVVDVHDEAGGGQARHEADHAAVPAQHLSGSQEVLHLRVDSRGGLSPSVDHHGAFAPDASAAGDGDFFLAGVALLGHVLNLLRGGAVCTMPMLGRGPFGGHGAARVLPRSMSPCENMNSTHI